MTAPEMMLTTTEAAAVLNISDETIRRYMDAGRLPSERLPAPGSRRRIWATDLAAFAEQHGLTADWTKIPE